MVSIFLENSFTPYCRGRPRCIYRRISFLICYAFSGTTESIKENGRRRLCSANFCVSFTVLEKIKGKWDYLHFSERVHVCWKLQMIPNIPPREKKGSWLRSESVKKGEDITLFLSFIKAHTLQAYGTVQAVASGELIFSTTWSWGVSFVRGLLCHQIHSFCTLWAGEGDGHTAGLGVLKKREIYAGG